MITTVYSVHGNLATIEKSRETTVSGCFKMKADIYGSEGARTLYRQLVAVVGA